MQVAARTLPCAQTSPRAAPTAPRPRAALPAPRRYVVTQSRQAVHCQDPLALLGLLEAMLGAPLGAGGGAVCAALAQSCDADVCGLPAAWRHARADASTRVSRQWAGCSWGRACLLSALPPAAAAAHAQARAATRRWLRRRTCGWRRSGQRKRRARTRPQRARAGDRVCEAACCAVRACGARARSRGCMGLLALWG